MKELTLNEVQSVSGGRVSEEAVLGLGVATAVTTTAFFGSLIAYAVAPGHDTLIAFASTFGVAVATSIAYGVVSDVYIAENGGYYIII
ncbi:MAG: hypothetical protein CMF48_01990 [Legionellales bacterium]|nr:hypothetical protein [Legionellales bacterium]|tara:strand:+ start:2207 stop:2470 length:264 start_codon:yes stop_codon:yes gene_type:complete